MGLFAEKGDTQALRFLNNIIAIFVIVIIGFIIIPLSPFFLDMMFIINITVSVLIQIGRAHV